MNETVSTLKWREKEGLCYGSDFNKEVLVTFPIMKIKLIIIRVQHLRESGEAELGLGGLMGRD